jgi:hypothetical protein
MRQSDPLGRCKAVDGVNPDSLPLPFMVILGEKNSYIIKESVYNMSSVLHSRWCLGSVSLCRLLQYRYQQICSAISCSFSERGTILEVQFLYNLRQNLGQDQAQYAQEFLQSRCSANTLAIGSSAPSGLAMASLGPFPTVGPIASLLPTERHASPLSLYTDCEREMQLGACTLLDHKEQMKRREDDMISPHLYGISNLINHQDINSIDSRLLRDTVILSCFPPLF